jgi:hypothetical protein
VTTRSLLAALVSFLAVDCGALPSDPITPVPWTLEVTAIELAIPTDSSEPHLTMSPQGAIVSWVEGQEGTATAKFAERTSNGWSEPRPIASGDDWFRSYADMPSVLRLSNGTLVANWLPATDPFIEAYDLYLAYSTDDGLNWSEPFSPHHDGTTTQHGFASIFERPEGGIGLVWLDGRQQELDVESPDGGAMSLRYATFDETWVQTTDQLVDDRVCECCPTTVGLTDEGVITAFRDRNAEEIRDIHVSRLVDGEWTRSAPVHDDRWTILACPVNGPVLSARGTRVAVAWFTATDNAAAYVAFSDDAGRTFGGPIRLDEAGTLGRVDVVLLQDGSAAATWLEFTDGRSELRVRRVEPSGARSSAVTLAGAGPGRPTGNPGMVLDEDRLIFAWTETTPPGDTGNDDPKIQVRVAEAILP